LRKHPHHQQSGQARRYEIKIQGQLDETWTDWFNGMAITMHGNVTTLRGMIKDQAALRGILVKIWDLNLTLIAINIIENET
jgi:hypothetical protein